MERIRIGITKEIQIAINNSFAEIYEKCPVKDNQIIDSHKDYLKQATSIFIDKIAECYKKDN